MEQLLKNQKSLMISSIDKDNNPAISYAPFVMIGEKIYVYLSKAANHYYNLRDNKKCAVMIIEDESLAQTIFARARLSFDCEAKIVEDVSEDVFNKFDEVHDAKMMAMFKKMDFDMFELDIIQGRLVKGFGQAFDIKFVNGEIQSEQVTGIGHRN
ncbi:HugZ family pyridoxamine 5'-phosphate oxidase [Faecalimicrobium sp. JNUCC 81]